MTALELREDSISDITMTTSNTPITVGIIGFGIMGRGIAEVAALSGHKIIGKASRSTPWEKQIEQFGKSRGCVKTTLDGLGH